MFTLFCITAFIWRPFHLSETSATSVQSTHNYRLRYAITENQPDDLQIGKLDDDLQQNPDMQSAELIQFLQSSRRSNLRFQLREPSAYFRLHAITSVLTTIKSIDLEALCPRHCPVGSPRAQLHLFVNVWLDSSVFSTILVEVAVIDVDDNEPRFPSNIARPYVMQLKEVLYRPGMQIQLPEALDRDVQPEHAKIAYRLESHPDDVSNALDTFQLLERNDSRLMLLLQRDLDYETTSIYRFFLVAWSPQIGDYTSWRGHRPVRNEKYEDQLEIRVNVLNINDIEPVFSKPAYKTVVPEDFEVGSVLFTLAATDADIDSTITYSMEQVLDSELAERFRVEQDGRVLLQSKLNYERRRDFSLPVRASDGEFFALSRLEITVTDVNDEPPEMVTVPATVVVEENKPVRTMVGQLYIIDRDGVTVNGQVECREPDQLVDEQPLLFVPNENTDSGSGSKVMRLTNQGDEEYPSGFNLPMPEVGIAEATVYKSYSLYTRVAFDREAAVGQESYDSLLICWDGVQGQPDGARYKSLTSTLTVHLRVDDANDNRPVFERQYYEGEVKENCPVGTRVLQVHASDADSKLEHKPQYEVHSNELLTTASFSIEPKTGWIVTSGDIDRETQAIYQLTILAVDGWTGTPSTGDRASKRHTSTAYVQIRVLDENDNSPEFRGPRQFAVEENQAANTWVGDLQAVDRDTEVNRRLEFLLADNSKEKWTTLVGKDEGKNLKNVPFRLTSNGSLFTTSMLDRENQSHYCFEVTVKDKPSPDALSTTDTFCIRVLDVNDNKPGFTKIRGSLQDEYAEFNLTSLVNVTSNASVNKTKPISLQKSQTLHLPEDTVHVSWFEQPGYCALIAEATDADEGRNSQLVFSFKSLSKPAGRLSSVGREEEVEAAFQMEPLTGRLILTRTLHTDSLGPRDIVLTVRDSGDPKLSVEKTIKLVITDQPPKGNWLLSKQDQLTNANGEAKRTVSLTNTVLTGIILTGVSTLLAAALITAILCMVKPCRKARGRQSGEAGSHRKQMKEDSFTRMVHPMACIPGDACGFCEGYSFRRTSLTDGYRSPFDSKLITSGVLLSNSNNFQLPPGVEHQLFMPGDPVMPISPGGLSENNISQRNSQRDSCVFIASPHATNFGTFSSAALSGDRYTENCSNTDSTWLANTQVWSPPPTSYVSCNTTCSGMCYQIPSGSCAFPLLSPEVTTDVSSPNHNYFERIDQQQQLLLQQEQQQQQQQQYIPFGDNAAFFSVGNNGIPALRQELGLPDNGGSLDRQTTFVGTSRLAPEATVSGGGGDIGARIVAVVGGLGEEQRSDSGRGGSDEEVSNQHLTPIIPKPLLVSAHIDGGHTFRSATVRTYCPDPSSGYALSNLVYPNLPRVMARQTDGNTSTFGRTDIKRTAETLELSNTVDG